MFLDADGKKKGGKGTGNFRPERKNYRKWVGVAAVVLVVAVLVFQAL